MSEENENISHYMNSLRKQVLNAIEFIVPKDYFITLETSVTQKIVSASESEQEEVEFFDRQSDQILKMIAIDNVASRGEEFQVPAEYFENLSGQVVLGLSSADKVKVIPMYRTAHARMWYGIAAAASIAFALVMLWPDEKPMEVSSFAQLLEQTKFDETDLELYATDEDYEAWIADEMELLLDTNVTDSNNVLQQVLPDEPMKESLDKRNDKKGTSIKPTDKKNALNWDDITEEELLEYLMEEGDNDLLEEL